MMVKSGLEKFILKSLHAGRWPSMREDGYFCYLICDFGHFYEARKNSLLHKGISKRFFLDSFSPSILGQKLYCFDTDSFLRVKMMYEYESVKQDVLRKIVAKTVVQGLLTDLYHKLSRNRKVVITP